MLEQLRISDFEARVGRQWRVRVDEETTIELELIDVSPLGAAPDSDQIKRQAFSCVFRGPTHPILAQQICPLEQEDTGVLHLFLVPLGLDGEGMRYEAVFT